MRDEKCRLIAGQRDINATYGVYRTLNEMGAKIQMIKIDRNWKIKNHFFGVLTGIK